MKKGYVRITNELIKQALKFPFDWEIEEIKPYVGKSGVKYSHESIMLISGSGFPETNNRGEAEEVRLIIHEKDVKFEIQKI